MTDGGIKMGMTPRHPGAFIRVETHEELELSVSGAARIPGVRRRDRRSAVSAGMIVALRQFFHRSQARPEGARARLVRTRC